MHLDKIKELSAISAKYGRTSKQTFDQWVESLSKQSLSSLSQELLNFRSKYNLGDIVK